MEILRAENVTMRFGGILAVDSVNLSVNKGEIVGIIGPNGAGKTTFFNMLTGIYEPTEGTVRLHDIVLNKMKPHQIAELGISRTFQNIRLFDKMTVLENVMLGRHARMKCNLADALFHTKRYRQVEADGEAYALNLLEKTGLAQYRYDDADSLPYGLQRKLEIARAMATEPEILLLDEPAAGMNENETLELNAFIAQIRDMGFTIVIIEHDVRLIMSLCDRVYVLDHGALIAEGTPEVVRKNPAVMEAYLGKEE